MHILQYSSLVNSKDAQEVLAIEKQNELYRWSTSASIAHGSPRFSLFSLPLKPFHFILVFVPIDNLIISLRKCRAMHFDYMYMFAKLMFSIHLSISRLSGWSTHPKKVRVMLTLSYVISGLLMQRQYRYDVVYNDWNRIWQFSCTCFRWSDVENIMFLLKLNGIEYRCLSNGSASVNRHWKRKSKLFTT